MHSGKYAVRIGWVAGTVVAGAVYACGCGAEAPGNSDAGADGPADDATLDGSHPAIDGATVDATLGDARAEAIDAPLEVDADASGGASADASEASFDAALDGHPDASGEQGEVGDALAEGAVDAGADATDAAATAVVCAGPCNGTIFDGGCVETLATGQPVPQGIATDGINVYWTDNPPLTPDAGAVMRVSVCGGTPVAIASGPISPQFVAVDDTNVYWTQSSSVVAWNKSTGAITTLAYNQPFPAGIVVDSANLYWANDVADGGLMRMPLDGGAPTAIVSHAPNPYRLVLSPTTVYWVEPFTSFIFFAPRTGGAPTTFYYDTNYEVADLAIDDNNLYYTEKSSLGPLEVLPLDGGSKSMLARDNGTQGVVSDGKYVYYASANGDSTSDGEIVRVPIDGGAPTVLATGGYPEEIAIDATSVYWTSSRSQIIGKVSPR